MSSIISCDERHAPAILAILNEIIRTSTASYDEHPKTLATMVQWMEKRQAEGFPVFAWLNDEHVVLGFASYGPFRAWSGYRFTIEHSVYVADGHRGAGIGRQLLAQLIEHASGAGFHTMIGGIDADNVASARLHCSMGFTKCAEIREAGFKFNRWLDLHFYQRILGSDDSPGSMPVGGHRG